MDKKLLVSLMMTAPVSVFAAQWVGNGDGDLSYEILAEVNQNNWKANGVSTDYTTNAEGRLVLGTQTGFIYHEAKLTAQGKYSLDATGLVKNAYFKVGATKETAEVQYVKNDKGQYLDANGNVTTKPEEYVYATKFDVVQSNAANAVYIEVCPVNKDLEFEVGDISLVFEFNFKTAQEGLKAEWVKTKINKVPTDDNRKDALALNTEYNTLDNKNKEIEGWIDSIVLTDGDKLLAAYNTYHLGNYNTDFAKATDDISNSIRSLQATVGMLNSTTGNYPAGSYNARVDAEIKAWDNIVGNRSNLAALEDKIAQLKAALAAKKDVANDINTTDADLKKFCQNALADELATAQNDITALENAVKAAYPKDSESNPPTTLVPSADYNKEADRVSVYIDGISYTDAVADWTAYGDFLDARKQLTKDNETIFGNINDLYRISNYKINGKNYSVKNVYDDVTGDANNALADAYKQNDGYTYVNDKGETVTVIIVERTPANYKDIMGARLWLATVQDEMDSRRDGMNDAETTLKDLYNNQEIALNGKSKYSDEPYNPDNANAIIGELQANLTKYENFRDSRAFQSLNATDQAKLKGFITDMQNALTKLCNTTNTEYLAHKLNVNGGQFATDKAAFDAKEQAYNDYLNNTVGEKVVTLINMSNDLREYVDAQTSTVKNSTLGVDYSSDLFNKFVSSMDNIDEAIANYYGTKAADRTDKAYDDIENGIIDVKNACKEIVKGFNDALAELAKAQTANNTFKNVLDNKVLIGDNGKGLYNKTPDENKQKGFATQINTFKDDLKEIATDSEMNVQEAYEAANDTTKEVVDADLPTAIKKAQDAFVTAATDKNSENVKKMLDDINKYKTTAPTNEYPGMDEVDLVKDINGGYTSIYDSYNTTAGKIPAAGTDVAKLGAIDNELKAIVDKCAGVNAKIQNVLDNHSKYVSLNNTKDGIASSIRTYRLNVMNYTVNPAAQHYIEVLGDLLDELQDIHDGKSGYTGYWDTYKAVKLTQTDPNLYQGYVEDLNAVKAKFEQVKQDLSANQDAWSELMNLSDALSVKINEDNGTLNDFDDVAYTDEYQDMVADLTTKLGNLNDRVTADFGDGALIDAEKVLNYRDEYKNLTEELDNIIDEWTEGYHSAVVEHNAEFLKPFYLDDNSLNDQYTDAIAYVNEYLYKVYNVNFYPMLVDNETFIKNHNALQENFKKIEKLNYQLHRFVEFITPANNTNPASQKVLSKEDPNYPNYGQISVKFENEPAEMVTLQSLITAAAEINQSIITCLTGIDQEGVKQANAFWTANGQVAVDAWDDIASRLEAAGFSTEEIDEYYGTELSEINTIKTVYAADKAALDGAVAGNNGQNAAAHTYILNMDAFAQMIDGLNAEVVRKAGYPLLPEFGDRDEEQVEDYVDGKVYAAVNSLWSSKSSETASELNELLAEIEDYKFDSAVGSFANNKKVITDALDRLSELNEEWNDMLDPSRESKLPSNLAELETLLSDSEDAVDSAKENFTVYMVNQTVYKEVITNDGSVYKQAEQNIDDLLEWSSYRSDVNINADENINSQKTNYDQLAVIEGLRTALESAKNTVINNIGSETTKVTVASQSAIINAVGVNQVNTAYSQIFGLEKNYANSMMVVLRSAFNTVNLMVENGDIDSVDKDQLNKWDGAINELSTNIYNATYNANDRKGCMDTLKGYEKVISDLIATIQSNAEGYDEDRVINTKQDTLNNLDAQYTDASSEISNFISSVQNAKVWGEGTYTKPEQDKYEGLANELQQLLDSYKSDYDGDGVNVIQDAAEYSWKMSQLMTGKFAEISKGWNEAYNGTNKVKGAEAKDYSDFHYGELVKSLDDLWDATEYAQGQAVEHEIDYSNVQFTTIDQEINGWTDDKNVFHNGLKQIYKNKAEGWNITSSDQIDSDLTEYVYGFVRNTLYTVANMERSNADDKADYLMSVVEVPGVNENGWKLSFIDAENIISSILEDKIDLSNIDLTYTTCAILKYRTVVNNTVRYSDTNPDQAKEAYLAIMEQIKDLDENIDKTYNDAVRDNLIVKGDVNDDKKINILDVQKLITVVLDQEAYDAADKDSHIKDVNDDKDINVGDVTTLINWVIDGQEGKVQAAPSKLAKFMKAFSGNNTYRVEEVVGENGYRRYAMLLTNETSFAAGQLNIKLPSHSKVAGVRLGDRADALDVYVQDNGDFTTVVMTSLDNSMIQGNNGCVLFIDIEGNGEPEVEKVIFSDIRGNAYNLSNATTGVDGIYESIKDGVKSIYNAAGQKLRGLTKGVNIIRNADGTTTKKIGK